MKNSVIYVVDENELYNKKCATSIYTIVQTTKTIDFDIIVVTNKRNQFLSNIKKVYNDIKFIFIDDYDAEFRCVIKKYEERKPQPYRMFPPSVFYKLIVFHPIIQSNYGKVIFLDCDTEVKKDIHNMFNVSSGTKYGIMGMVEFRNTGVVPNWFSNFRTSTKYGIEHGFQKGIKFYINAGVFLVDCVNINRYVGKDVFNRLMDISVNDNIVRYCEQTIINTYFNTYDLRPFFGEFKPMFNDFGGKLGKETVVAHYVKNVKMPHFDCVVSKFFTNKHPSLKRNQVKTNTTIKLPKVNFMFG